MNLEKVYQIVRERDEQINSYFQILPPDLEKVFLEILTQLEVELSRENLLILKRRFFHLREDVLQLLFDQINLPLRQRQKWQLKIYEQVRNFWMEEHRRLIDRLNPYLSPFYRHLFKGIHQLGKVFSQWQPVWTAHILHNINGELSLLFGGDEGKIMAFLETEGLLDQGHFEEVGERCYSVLVREGNKFKVASYRTFFYREVTEGIQVLENLIAILSSIPASDSEQPEKWIAYLTAFKEALKEERVEKLIVKWAEVDRRWMEVTTPIQMGHPLEYYEDRYRKAVALELDIRIQNPNLKSKVKNQIVQFYQNYCTDSHLLEIGLKNIAKTQLYLSTPALFYGAELNGLFSAQVVPNDEVVSQKMGKKIFAYGEKIFGDLNARPKMAISYKILGEEFMREWEKIITDWNLFFQLYDITTIGHEFGHILWVDGESETALNRTGMFKNVEEWKATTGGLVAHFLYGNRQLDRPILLDLIKRSTGLIEWMEVEEVLPYYIEGLIHLTGLFKSGILRFEKGFLIYDYSVYAQLKKWYLDTYLNLTQFYLQKRDVRPFLERFIIKKDGRYLPLHRETAQFVLYYQRQYKEIGSQMWKG